MNILQTDITADMNMMRTKIFLSLTEKFTAWEAMLDMDFGTGTELGPGLHQ